MLPLKRTALVALLYRFLLTWIRFVLMLCYFMVATKLHAKPVAGLLGVYEDMVEVLLVLDIFLT